MFCICALKVFKFCLTAATESAHFDDVFRNRDEKGYRNKFGRSYHPGVALDQDFKCVFIAKKVTF